MARKQVLRLARIVLEIVELMRAVGRLDQLVGPVVNDCPLAVEAILPSELPERWIDQTLPFRLTERGFDAVLTTVISSQYKRFGAWGWRRVLGESVAENAGSESNVWREDVSNLFALGLFRLSPHFLKPRIYDDGSWQARRLFPPHESVVRDPRIHHETRTDLGILDELMASASADDSAPRFRLIHLWGAHRPYTVDERCRYADYRSATTRRKVVRMTHCVVSRVFAFLHKLDEIGVYDKSLIFVLADHGGDMPIDLSTASPALHQRVKYLASSPRISWDRALKRRFGVSRFFSPNRWAPDSHFGFRTNRCRCATFRSRCSMHSPPMTTSNASRSLQLGTRDRHHESTTDTPPWLSDANSIYREEADCRSRNTRCRDTAGYPIRGSRSRLTRNDTTRAGAGEEVILLQRVLPRNPEVFCGYGRERRVPGFPQESHHRG